MPSSSYRNYILLSNLYKNLPNLLFQSTWLIIFSILGFIIACSKVKFNAMDNCNSVKPNESCIVTESGRSFSGEEKILGGKVDIVIVNDNSASMSFEQRQLATRFGGFIDLLENKQIDYRIGIITTDISSGSNPPRPINQNGALQDGKLIPLSDGSKFISSLVGISSSRKQVFQSVGSLVRPETLSCESFIKSWVDAGKSINSPEYLSQYNVNCPSTDERGMYAANLFINNNPEQFLRQESDLAIIVLSDEDVRSQLYWNKTPGFDLESNDKGSNLISNIKSKFPSKKFGIHSFITTDQQCLNEQTSQLNGVVSGSFGWEYYNTTLSSGGVWGSICEKDYTPKLNDIFKNITIQLIDKIALHCNSPKNLKIETTSVGIGYSIHNSELVFNSKLPIGTIVKYSYECSQNVK